MAENTQWMYGDLVFFGNFGSLFSVFMYIGK